MTHAGQVKCIYIDPPYNTGAKDWVYNDHYVDKTDRWRQSTWLEFLYQRLLLAKDLLASHGVMLISINDEQRAKLELLCEQALEGMRVGSLVWRTRTGGNDTEGAFLSPDHEHVLVYAGPDFRFGGGEKTFELYEHYDAEKDDWYRLDNLTGPKDRHERPLSFYPIHDPIADVWYPCNPHSVWRYATKANIKPRQRLRKLPMEDLVATGQIAFPEEQRVEVYASREQLDLAISAGGVPTSGRVRKLFSDLPDLDFWVGKRVGFGTPAFKRYKNDLRNATQPLSSWITPRAEADTIAPDANTIISGTNDEGAKIIKDVFGEKAFNYAKPVSLVRELIRQATGPDDLVVDFFAGSSTTAQAVMELNTEDGGTRHFIMVFSTEATTAEPGKNVCRNVTAERIRRLNTRDDAKYGEMVAPFAYLTLEQIDFADLDYDLRPEQAWAALEAIHGLPLTTYDPAAAWQEHVTDEQVLLLAAHADEGLGARLAALADARTTAHVYAFAPGQVEALLGPHDLPVRSVRDILVQRFRS